MNVEAEVDSSVSLHVLGNQKCCVLHPSQAKNITHWPSCHVFARTEALKPCLLALSEAKRICFRM